MKQENMKRENMGIQAVNIYTRPLSLKIPYFALPKIHSSQ